MAWTKPDFSHHQVDVAGDLLTDLHAISLEDLDRALNVVNNWRSCHGCALQSLKMTLLGRAKKIDEQALIAQRIKRIRAIIVKLRRNPNMKLSKMHDIGGCRAIMRSVSQVESLVEVYEKATAKNRFRGGEFIKKYDYIKEPKQDGYRGVHLVYKYVSDSKNLEVFNGLRIEIQLRSKLQHAWATAVEAVDFYTKQALKSNMGEASWKQFFSLVANAFAHIEKRPPVPGITNDLNELRNQLKSFSTQLSLLEGVKTATETTENKEGDFFLLLLNSKERTVKTVTFQREELPQAQESYLNLEKTIKDQPEMQAVLVSVDKLSELRKAYPNYFLDINGFVTALNKFLLLSENPSN